MHRSIPLVILAAAALAAVWLVPARAHDPPGGHAPSPGSLGAFDLDSPRTVSPETARVIDLQTAEAAFGPIEEVVRLGGFVQPRPDHVQRVSAPVGGFVRAVYVRAGDTVARGQAVAEVFSPELARSVSELATSEVHLEQLKSEVIGTQSGVDQYRTQLTSIKEQARLAEEELARLQAGGEAVGANVLSQKQSAAVQLRAQATAMTYQVEQQERTLESLERRVVATERSIDVLRGALDLIHARSGEASKASPPPAAADAGLVVLRSNITGLVTSREVVLGQGVEVGQPLVMLVDYSAVEVSGELPESLIDRLRDAVGKPVRIGVSAFSGGEPRSQTLAEGAVRVVSPVVDPVKRTIHLIVQADNPEGRLRDGMYVELAVIIRRLKTAVVIPASALLQDGPTPFVFLREGDRYVKHDVVPGARDDRFVEMLDQSLVPGDVVVTRGGYSLAQIRPAPSAPQAQPIRLDTTK